MTPPRFLWILMPLRAFFSRQLYHELGHHRRRGISLYLVLLALLIAIPTAYRIHTSLCNAIGCTPSFLLRQLPPLALHDGRIKINQTQAIRICNYEGATVALVDTTGSRNFIEPGGPLALLTETKLIIRCGSDAYRIVELNRLPEFRLTPEQTDHSLAQYSTHLLLLFYGAVTAATLIALTGCVFIAALLASLTLSARKRRIPFSGAFRIALVAATPAALCTALILGLPGVPHALVPLCGALYLTYLLFSVEGAARVIEPKTAQRSLADLLADAPSEHEETEPDPL